MKDDDIKVCSIYGLSVNLLIDAVEELMVDALTSDTDLIEKDMDRCMRAIRRVRDNEKEFKELLISGF